MVSFNDFLSSYIGSSFTEGGKTGITGMVIGVMFFISVFFAPIFASIPSWATGSALTIAGSLMVRKCVRIVLCKSAMKSDKPSVMEINWLYIGDAIPAFLTLVIIPLTYKYVVRRFFRDSVLIPILFFIQHCIRCYRRCHVIHVIERHPTTLEKNIQWSHRSPRLRSG